MQTAATSPMIQDETSTLAPSTSLTSSFRQQHQPVGHSVVDVKIIDADTADFSAYSKSSSSSTSNKRKSAPSPPHPPFGVTSSPSTSTSSSPTSGPAALLSAALNTPTAAVTGSPLLRNTTVPQGGAGIRLRKTLSLGEQKHAVALPVVAIPTASAAATDTLRRFPPPPASSSAAPASSKEAAAADSSPQLKPGSHHSHALKASNLVDTTTDHQRAAVRRNSGTLEDAKPQHETGPTAREGSNSGARNYIVFPSLAEMADTEAGKKASLSLCSDGTPSIQFRRHFLFGDAGINLFSNLTAMASWKEELESYGTKCKSAWFGDAHAELSSAGVVINHEEWSRIPLLRELRDKLESEFHTTFNAVHCSYFRTGSEACGGYPVDAASQDTDAVFICLGQKRNLLLSPKAKLRPDSAMAGKLPHVRVVMEANAALFVHRAARSLYDYSVPQSDEPSPGGNIILCFRRLPATPRPIGGRERLRSSKSRTEGDRAGPSAATSQRSVHRDKSVIYIDEDDEGNIREQSRLSSESTKRGETKGAVTKDHLLDYVGRIFYSRQDLFRLGLHQSYSSSICGGMEKGAESILLLDASAPAVDERLLYTCMTNSHENQVERAVLQINVLNDVPIRLVRGWRADFDKSSRSVNEKDERMWYRYDGLYSVRNCSDEMARLDDSSRREEGSVFCQFLLTRLPLYPAPPTPKRSEPPKPTLPSISSITGIPPSPFRDARNKPEYISRDYGAPVDDDGVEIVDVKGPALPSHLMHNPSTSTSASYSQQKQQQQQQRLPPTSALLNAGMTSSPRRAPNSPPHATSTSTSSYPPLAPAQRQPQPQQQQAMPSSSIPLPGILPYVKNSYAPSPPSSSGGGATSTKASSGVPSMPAAILPLPAGYGPVPGLSPTTANTNLNMAMLMYNMFGGNPLVQHAGLAPHGVSGPFGEVPMQLAPPELLPRLVPQAQVQQQQPQQQQQQQYIQQEQAAPAVLAAAKLRPSLYEVPTVHLLFFMNQIPQKDREIAQIMRQKELDEQAKRKRKEEQSGDKKRKRRRKEEAVAQVAPAKNNSKKSNGSSGDGSKLNKQASRKRTAQDEEYIDLGLLDNEDDEIITTWSSRRRGAAGQKKASDTEWEKAKELPTVSERKRRKGGSSSAAPPAPTRSSKDTSPSSSSGKRSRSDRKSRAAEGNDYEDDGGGGSLFCICRSPEEYGFMIACDKCNDWFHGGCVGLTPDEGKDLKTYICPRCQPANARKKALPFGDALSFASSTAGGHGGRAQRAKSEAEDEEEIEEEKIEWKQLGEVIYCGDGEMDDDFDSDDPSGFIFVAYSSFDEIAKEREEAAKTREDHHKKRQQQKYLQQRLQDFRGSSSPSGGADLGGEPPVLPPRAAAEAGVILLAGSS